MEGREIDNLFLTCILLSLFFRLLLKAFHWLVKKGSGFQMHCDLAQFKSWSDAQMGICGLKELVRDGGGEAREEKASEIKRK